VDVLRANTDEAEQLTGIKPQDRESARQALDKASPFANAAAALATTEIGAQPSLPRRDEVAALLEQHE
jgi:sugar/nucleoside kinase (ribokinase family)